MASFIPDFCDSSLRCDVRVSCVSCALQLLSPSFAHRMSYSNIRTWNYPSERAARAAYRSESDPLETWNYANLWTLYPLHASCPSQYRAECPTGGPPLLLPRMQPLSLYLSHSQRLYYRNFSGIWQRLSPVIFTLLSLYSYEIDRNCGIGRE